MFVTKQISGSVLSIDKQNIFLDGEPNLESVYQKYILLSWIIGVQKQRKLMLKLEKLFEWLDSMYSKKIKIL